MRRKSKPLAYRLCREINDSACRCERTRAIPCESIGSLLYDFADGDIDRAIALERVRRAKGDAGWVGGLSW